MVSQPLCLFSVGEFLEFQESYGKEITLNHGENFCFFFILRIKHLYTVYILSNANTKVIQI